MSAERVQLPAVPRRSAFYYGWLMVPLGALAMVATLPGRTHGLGLITVKLMGDFKLTQESFAEINLWGTLFGAIFCLPCGVLIDRYGARSVLTAVLLALGASTLWMTTVETSAGLFWAVLLSRGLGQSMLSVVSLALIGKWFGRSLGWAMGVFTVLMGFGMGSSFGLIGWLVSQEGWRAAWWNIGLAVTGLGLAALVMGRSSPRDPLREFASREKRTDTSESTPSATLRQALSNPAFWMFAATSSFFGLTTSAVSLFNELMFAERGFPQEIYYQVVGTSFLIGMASNLVGGWLATRVRLERLSAVAMLLLALAYACFPYVATLGQLYAYAATSAVAGGIVTVLFFTAWGHCFGRGELGRIQGVAQMATVVASAVGPQLVASWHSATGSYSGAFQISALVCVGLAGWALVTRVPTAREGTWRAKPADADACQLSPATVA